MFIFTQIVGLKRYLGPHDDEAMGCIFPNGDPSLQDDDLFGDMTVSLEIPREKCSN